MTPDPTSVSAVPGASAATPSVGGAPSSAGGAPLTHAAPRRWQVDPRYVAPLLITAILLVGQITAGILDSYSKLMVAITAGILTELVLGRLMYGKWPNLASAYVTGISVGILIRSPLVWPYALCSIISIASKYVLQMKGRHLWNPSNFGISTMLFLAPNVVASLSIQFGNSLAPMLLIWLLGAVIIWRLKRFHICATYVISFVAFAALRSILTGQPWLAEIAPITGPMYQLYIFFMITDPKSTVKTRRGQMLVAFCVALAECILRLFHNIHAPYYALFLVGPIANFIEIRSASHKTAPALAARPA